MLILWWTGKGYLTPIIVMASLMVFGIILQVGQPVVPDQPWFWAISLFVAAGANWSVGSRLNRKTVAALRSARGDRLLYRARHNFLSVPMDSFSVVLTVIGIVAVTYHLIR